MRIDLGMDATRVVLAQGMGVEGKEQILGVKINEAGLVVEGFVIAVIVGNVSETCRRERSRSAGQVLGRRSKARRCRGQCRSQFHPSQVGREAPRVSPC